VEPSLLKLMNGFANNTRVFRWGRIHLRRLVQGLLVLVVNLLCCSCYLSSPKPSGDVTVVNERDSRLGESINSVLKESSEYLKDLSRILSYTVGAMAKNQRTTDILTELPEYVSLFNATEVEPLIWNSQNIEQQSNTSQSGNEKRFSREIWNESVYLMQRKNPNFRMRVEGRVKDPVAEGHPPFERLVFILDREKEKVSRSSHAFLTARPICQNGACKVNLRISYRDIAEGLNELTPQGSWQGTTGVLSATLSEDSTKAELETFKIQTSAVSVNVKNFKYDRARGTNVSNAVMFGTISSKVFTDTEFLIRGNIRDAATVSVLFGDAAKQQFQE